MLASELEDSSKGRKLGHNGFYSSIASWKRQEKCNQLSFPSLSPQNFYEAEGSGQGQFGKVKFSKLLFFSGLANRLKRMVEFCVKTYFPPVFFFVFFKNQIP